MRANWGKIIGYTAWPIKIDQFVSQFLIAGLTWNFVCGIYGRWYVIGASLEVIPEGFDPYKYHKRSLLIGPIDSR